MFLKINKQTEIYIYGAGEVGRKCAKSLELSGYRIQLMLDGNKEGEDVCPPYKVVRISNVDKHRVNFNNSAIIICLADGMIHKGVAEKLKAIGFIYIVFLPIEYGLPPNIINEYVRMYNDILAGRNIDNTIVPSIEEVIAGQFPDLDSFDSDQSESLVFPIPLELLYSEDYVNTRNDKRGFTGSLEIFDTPLEAFEWYLDLWRYLDGESDDPGAFFDSFREELSEDKKHAELSSREKLLRLYDRQLTNGLSFFESSAPIVGYNKKRNCFNLVGGHHRVSYLIYRGFRMIPCRISKEDFIYWFNDSVANELKKIIIDYGIDYVNAPIPHPMFCNLSAKRGSFGNSIMENVYLFFRREGIIDFKVYDVLDMSRMDGLYSRCMRRLDSGRILRIADNVEYEECISRLLRLDISVLSLADLDSYNMTEKDNIVFADDHLSNPDEYDNRESFIDDIVKTIRRCKIKYLFYESNNILEDNELLSDNGFKFIRDINSEKIDGKNVVMSVYSV